MPAALLEGPQENALAQGRCRAAGFVVEMPTPEAAKRKQKPARRSGATRFAPQGQQGEKEM
jgi:hypothetical protein